MKIAEEIKIDGSRILVVDDDGIIRMLLCRLLERSGFVVDEANSGESAIECIEAHEPDLILLDVIMNGIDGFVTCRKIKEMPGLRHVPIIFLTGRSDISSIVEGLDAGGCDYVAKPINRHEALARMRHHLKMRVLMSFQRQCINGLKKGNLAKNRIIGVASHDLRNPLASIRGLSDFLIESGPLNNEQQEIVETIQSTSDSMLHLVDKLLDLSMINSGKEHSNAEPCQVREVISSSINIYQFAANKKSIKLTLDDRGMPEKLMLDKAQFRRLMDNLLSNAVKYSPFCSFIRVMTEQVNGIFKIVIEDEGPGIPEDEMHKLFTHFGKTSVQPTGNETSTGLGLAICREIVEFHRGKVYAKNREDRVGARFTVELDTLVLAVCS
ncbi:MAG: response regulator [Opitutae bacterium]|nr:response regulator [Opitutae bacterium]MDG1301520.1 response regulator [Opitutae bacterium]